MKAQNWSNLKTQHEKSLIIKFGAKRNFRPHFMPPSPLPKIFVLMLFFIFQPFWANITFQPYVLTPFTNFSNISK
jgi:hypothetical protein